MCLKAKLFVASCAVVGVVTPSVFPDIATCFGGAEVAQGLVTAGCGIFGWAGGRLLLKVYNRIYEFFDLSRAIKSKRCRAEVTPQGPILVRRRRRRWMRY